MKTYEIKQVQNGFIVTVQTEDYDGVEYVFPKEYQVIKFLKEQFKVE
jgi:hypothetical protein